MIEMYSLIVLKVKSEIRLTGSPDNLLSRCMLDILHVLLSLKFHIY